MKLPSIVAHADWSTSPAKRWIATATLAKDGTYIVNMPELVGPVPLLPARLLHMAKSNRMPESILLGVDFPIGLPLAYAEKANIEDFLDTLLSFGVSKRWRHFYEVCDRPEEIAIERPFFPNRPGQTNQAQLVQGVQVRHMADLLRVCDQPQLHRGAAAPLFWTMGAQQVGKAAITGWTELLVPAMRDLSMDCVVWPFEGSLSRLLKKHQIVIAEAYPTEFYHHMRLDVTNKRNVAVRRTCALHLLRWAESNRVYVSAETERHMMDGFGADATGEDRFDAMVSLFGMLNLLLNQNSAEPELSDDIRHIEGWILGLNMLDIGL